MIQSSPSATSAGIMRVWNAVSGGNMPLEYPPAGPGLRVDVLVELDLHAHVFLVKQRHQRVVIAERDEIHAPVAELAWSS